MGTLYLVATPIGNLDDITQRALQTLRSVKLIAAEDTRTARTLLSHYQITTPVRSYHEQGGQPRLEPLLRQLEEGDVALISEAGTPGISDPGYALVRAAVAAGHHVVAIPGPSAVTAALAASGLPVDQFTYVGFLPRRSRERRALLQELGEAPRSIVAFEAPHRLRASLADIGEVLGQRQICVCRELTKRHEELFRGTPAEALAHFARPRGEFTLVIDRGEPPPSEPSGLELRRRLQKMRAQGLRAKQAVSQVAEETGLPHRAVYREWLQIVARGKSPTGR